MDFQLSYVFNKIEMIFSDGFIKIITVYISANLRHEIVGFETQKGKMESTLRWISIRCIKLLYECDVL